MFDGHGKEGERISIFCAKEIHEYFNFCLELYEGKYKDFLTDALKYVETRLRDPSTGIDISNSGCSCVLVLVIDKVMHIASIGNSRAVIGTYDKIFKTGQKNSKFAEDKPFLRDFANRRKFQSNPKIYSRQLTINHTTENQDEVIRIFGRGGKVQQNSDKHGNRFGPYYIRKNFSNFSGLLVTRSIGDIIAEDIGVNCVPFISEYFLGINDQFLVIASEGVWTVMSNKDVANFVATYKTVASKEAKSQKNDCDVEPVNACIAQLLCEEARIRWLTLVENEDAMIEDISAIVLEFDQEGLKKSKSYYRMDPANFIERGSNVRKTEKLKNKLS